MKHELNRQSEISPADGMASAWGGDFESDEFGAIGFESACPALQAALWREAESPLALGAVDATVAPGDSP